MTRSNPPYPLLITGASGRLGRLVQVAAQSLPEAARPIFSARDSSADLVIAGSGPLPDLPRCHAVAALWGDTSATEASEEVNVALAARSLEVARACGATHLFHLSSAAVYGAGDRLVEGAPTKPSNLYGTAKLAMEHAVQAAPDAQVAQSCLRLANVVGADSLRAALTGAAPAQLTQFADGLGPLRSYLAPGDVLRVFLALAALPPHRLPATLNIAAPDPVPMAALLHAAGRPFEWTPAPERALQRVLLETDRLATLLPDLALHRSAEAMITDWRALERA